LYTYASLCRRVSLFSAYTVDALIIITILVISGLLGFWQEYGAMNAIQKLVALVQVKATVERDGGTREIPLEEIVPGDIISLKAGDAIPGDCLVLESKDLFVDEATLTGETYPVEKAAAVLAPDVSIHERTNTLLYAYPNALYQTGAIRTPLMKRLECSTT
jgi:Mg2+-importing ATPase